jgi:hypothetical protein
MGIKILFLLSIEYLMTFSHYKNLYVLPWKKRLRIFYIHFAICSFLLPDQGEGERWQCRSQKFLSIEQFLSQTILRLGQPWTIEKSTRLHTVFQNFLSFSKPMFMKEKSQQPSTNTRSCSVSLYYFTKVFFNFKVLYHLSCENCNDNHIFSWSNTGGYLASKPKRYKKLFAIDVKGFPRQFFSSHIFWKMSCSELFFHSPEIYSFLTASWTYQTYKLSIQRCRIYPRARPIGRGNFLL